MTERRLFADLDATGRFHRDTPVGGCLHRGLSFREDRAFDAVHVCVDGSRVSVHVDRFSPLNHRVGARFRYSAAGMVAHWAVDIVARGVRRAFRPATDDHCHLDCEVEWVPDDEVEPGELDGVGLAVTGGIPDGLEPAIRAGTLESPPTATGLEPTAA